MVYADNPQTLDHLEDNIRRVIADIRLQMLEKVIENWTSRLDYIRASRGIPMPEVIFKISIQSPELAKNVHHHDHQVAKMVTDVANLIAKTDVNLSLSSSSHGITIIIDEAHFLWNGYVNKQNCRIWSEANPKVYVETPLHPEKLTVWYVLWVGGILLQNR
ncbi:hypothetical protein TNCV_562541 [Trichonephila clavipes]|nr:hypothetical protein TNCV_562541 [Trichonephila clavipes]